MCNNDQVLSLPNLPISRGAALAHGCCGGFRALPVEQPTAQIISFVKPASASPGDCTNENQPAADSASCQTPPA